jgi:putative DNA methylase
MTVPKKLIEVAMPIKEISAESVRDKSIRHGHISTLHLWWARRPLPVCRAVVFASLVPDPLDPNCPQAFKDAIKKLLGDVENPKSNDPYKTYIDIPWTSIYDPMEDNLRNRLQMFIGKFTEDMQQHLLGNAPKPDAGKQLSNDSLIKWDNKNNENIINIARKLIFVSYQAAKYPQDSAEKLLSNFDFLYNNIKTAEQALYALTDRHLGENATVGEVANLADGLDKAIERFLDCMPKVFDPFAGGGAIPLEAARLGCRSFGNDINPVAHIIQKGSLEFPQKFGKPIVYSKDEFIKLYAVDRQDFDLRGKSFGGLVDGTTLELDSYADFDTKGYLIFSDNCKQVTVKNRLAFDVAFYAKKLLKEAETEIGHFYPSNIEGVKPIAYYWARVGTCSNPSCRAEVPLLRQLYLANTKSKQVYLKPIIVGNKIDFDIQNGAYEATPWMKSANLTCPCCGNVTDVKKLRQQFVEGKSKERLLAVIWEGQNGKEYKLPQQNEIDILNAVPNDVERPNEQLPLEHTGKFPRPWGLETWGGMFSNRQLLAIQTLISKLNILKKELNTEGGYEKAVITYLGILIDRVSIVNTTFGRWHVTGEKLEHPFSKQAIPMMFDYPESNMFCHSSGSAYNQLDWLTRYIESEGNNPFSVELNNSSSGDKAQFADKYLTAVVTDPPYYDAIAYADLSDFFYVWLKRTLGDVYPLNFATPQTPKTEECTALKHHHDGKLTVAKAHFENKLRQIFDAIEHQTSDMVSIMFAHQSTEAWTTLCNSILGARMNITGSWAMDTEMANRSLGLTGAVLASSVTVSCTPSVQAGYGEYKEVKKAIDSTVAREVEALYKLGFRGADLLTACFGKAVSEFGKYKMVEKSNGDHVQVSELLEMAKESAFNALLKGFNGDDCTKFYIGWLQLYGFIESDFDDAAKFSRIGLNINVGDLFTENILIKNGNKQTLGSFEERLKIDKHIGERGDSYLIDQVHRAMFLYKGTDRPALLAYIKQFAESTESPFWRVVVAIDELLPKGSSDHEQTRGLLSQKENLIRESKARAVVYAPQGRLEF